MRPGGGLPSCCFLALAPNILDFWPGLAHRGERRGSWCFVILVCGSGMGEGSLCRVFTGVYLAFSQPSKAQEPTGGVCGQCPGVQEGRDEPVEKWAA